jgi:uncharacterized YigZ family protein
MAIDNIPNNISEEDYYLTIEEFCETSLKIKSSNFIGQCFPLLNKQEAENKLNEIRSKYFDATHHCFAYVIGNDNGVSRFSDDGEPSGTAGKQILQAINHFNFKDILVVVIRYFGGTKLGVGPLARAYYNSASQTLSNAKPYKIFLTTKFEINCDYNSISLVKKLLSDYAVHFDVSYLNNVSFQADILNSKLEVFQESLIEKSNGKIQAKILKEF